jgi:competence protein ComEC
MNGLPAVAERFRPKTFFASMRSLDDPASAHLLDRLRKAGTQIRVVDSGSPAVAAGGAVIEILGPPAPNPPVEANDSSMVAKVSFEGTSFLLTGDIQSEGEDLLLASGRDISSTVLKVPHQGSRTSTHDRLLDAVRPRYAVIMAGEHNPYHLPSGDVVERLESRGVRVLRTDRDGTVTFVTGGEAVELACFLSACRASER